MITKETKTVYAWAIVTKRGALAKEPDQILVYRTRKAAEHNALLNDKERAVKVAIVVPKP